MRKHKRVHMQSRFCILFLFPPQGRTMQHAILVLSTSEIDIGLLEPKPKTKSTYCQRLIVREKNSPLLPKG